MGAEPADELAQQVTESCDMYQCLDAHGTAALPSYPALMAKTPPALKFRRFKGLEPRQSVGEGRA